MTTPTGTNRHPDVSEIADLTEGVLPSIRSAEIQRHVDECGLCADVRASLEGVRELLGALPPAPPMPSDVAARIDAVLISEAARGARVEDAASEPPTPLVGVDAVSRETSPAEASPVHPRADHSDSDAGPPGRPGGHPRAVTGPGRRPPRRRARRAILGAALGTAFIGASVFIMQGGLPSGGSGESLKSASRSADSATDEAGTFSETSLGARVDTLLQEATAPAAPSSGKTAKEAPSMDAESAPTSATPQAPLRAPAVIVPSCVAKGIGRNDAALAVEQGTYRGTRAYLVVLPHPTDPSRVEAYVVDAACVGAGTGAKGKLLLTHAYPRP